MVSYKNTIKVIECLISKINFATNERAAYIPAACVGDYSPTLIKFEKLGLIKIGYDGKSYDTNNKTYGMYVKEITNEGWYVFGKYFKESIDIKTEVCINCGVTTTKNVECKMPYRFRLYYCWLTFKSIFLRIKCLWLLSIFVVFVSNWSEIKSCVSDTWNMFPIDYKLVKTIDLNKY